PNLTVAITGYYDPLPQTISNQQITALCGQLKSALFINPQPKCKALLSQLNPAFTGANAVIQKLNTTIQNTVSPYNLSNPGHFIFVDVYNAFINHCTPINITISTQDFGNA